MEVNLTDTASSPDSMMFTMNKMPNKESVNSDSKDKALEEKTEINVNAAIREDSQSRQAECHGSGMARSNTSNISGEVTGASEQSETEPQAKNCQSTSAKGMVLGSDSNVEEMDKDSKTIEDVMTNKKRTRDDLEKDDNERNWLATDTVDSAAMITATPVTTTITSTKVTENSNTDLETTLSREADVLLEIGKHVEMNAEQGNPTSSSTTATCERMDSDLVGTSHGTMSVKQPLSDIAEESHTSNEASTRAKPQDESRKSFNLTSKSELKDNDDSNTSQPTTVSKSPHQLRLETSITNLESQLSVLRQRITETTQALLSLESFQSEMQSQPNTFPPDCDDTADTDTNATVLATSTHIVRKHIKLLHQYNAIRDIGMGMFNLIADARGVRLVEVLKERGLKGDD